jgi:predicted dehydrogenase
VVPKEGSSVSQSVGVGIVGTGLAARVQATILSALPDVVVVGFCSGSAERAELIASDFPGADATTHVEQLLGCDDVDLVSVTAAPVTHHPVSLSALRAGKAVLCEKPFALNAVEAAEMYAADRAAGPPTFVNFEFRRFALRSRMQELLADGYVGHVRTVYMTGSSNYYQLKSPNQSPWWLSSAEGGGWLGASASHDLDTLRFLVGDIAEVCADLPQFVPAHRVRGSSDLMSSDVDDCALLLLRFVDRARGVLATTAAASTPTTGNRIELYGSEGTLILTTQTRSGGPLYGGAILTGRREHDDAFEIFPAVTPEASSSDPHTGPGAAWLSDIVDAVRCGESVRPNFEDGFENQLLLDAARQSERDRGWVSVSDLRAVALARLSTAAT